MVSRLQPCSGCWFLWRGSTLGILVCGHRGPLGLKTSLDEELEAGRQCTESGPCLGSWLGHLPLKALDK